MVEITMNVVEMVRWAGPKMTLEDKKRPFMDVMEEWAAEYNGEFVKDNDPDSYSWLFRFEQDSDAVAFKLAKA